MAQVNLDRVQAFMKEQNISEPALAKNMDISYSYLFRVLRGKRQAGGKFINGLISIGMKPEEIFLPTLLPNGNTKEEGKPDGAA